MRNLTLITLALLFANTVFSQKCKYEKYAKDRFTGETTIITRHKIVVPYLSENSHLSIQLKKVINQDTIFTLVATLSYKSEDLNWNYYTFSESLIEDSETYETKEYQANIITHYFLYTNALLIKEIHRRKDFNRAVK